MAEKSTAAENRAAVVEEKVRKVPVFTVLKNSSILKNIFLIENPPPPHLLSSSSSQEINNSFVNEQDFEEVLVVGRHPDCNITLEHPSISRFHLRIHSVPSLQTLSVTDLSSVHGTIVCGKRIKSGVRVELHEGDTLQLGESSRIYRLHWVPLSCAYDIRNPFVPPMDQPGPMEDREGENETHQVENSLFLQIELSPIRGCVWNECSNLLLSKSKDKSSRSWVDFDVKPQTGKSFSIESLSEGITLSAEQVDDLIIAPDKERYTPHTLLKMSFKKLGQEKIVCELSLDSSTYDLNGDEEEVFTPDQENITPKTLLLRPIKMVKTMHPGRHHVMGGGLGSLDKRNELGEICCEKNAAISSASGIGASSKPEVCVLKGRQHRVPFQSLLVSPNGKNSVSFDLSASTRIHDSSKNPNLESIACSHKTGSDKYKKWTMVVDTGCLLHKESRKALQIMQGLPSTSLIIPRIVVRELDCMRRSRSLFRSTNQVSAALEWIEDCMVNTHWWIHVQSSEDDVRLVQPTPPASPFSRFTEENQRCQIVSVPFPPSSCLLEIVSPTTEDHVLDSALLFRRMRIIGHVILLSNDLPLKIKAMAEGLRCETAVEFHESLVNPFSERFLWTGCTPRGLTWSCHDDVVLREKYYNGLKTKQSTSVENVKGLKLILFYNSHLRLTSLSN